jgi:hypothetical protein
MGERERERERERGGDMEIERDGVMEGPGSMV